MWSIRIICGVSAVARAMWYVLMVLYISSASGNVGRAERRMQDIYTICYV